MDNVLTVAIHEPANVFLLEEISQLVDCAVHIVAATASDINDALHTKSATQTIERVIDVFEPQHQPQIRIQLAATLQAVVFQNLLRCTDGSGVVSGLEIMVMTTAVRRAIFDRDTHLLPGMIETRSKSGMRTFDHSLAELVAAGTVSKEVAVSRAADMEKPDRLL